MEKKRLLVEHQYGGAGAIVHGKSFSASKVVGDEFDERGWSGGAAEFLKKSVVVDCVERFTHVKG